MKNSLAKGIDSAICWGCSFYMNEVRKLNKLMKRKLLLLALALSLLLFLSSCNGKNEKVIIYSSAEEYRNTYILSALQAHFPSYTITLQYMPSGNQIAKLVSEGKNTACCISYDIDYGYLGKVADTYADTHYDKSLYLEDVIPTMSNVVPEYRNGGCIVINKTILDEKGLPVPQSYQELADPKYKGLVSMPNPKSSGTGYMFLKSLVNAWGEEKAFAYFDALSENILQFTSSGSGPVNALSQGEAAIGLGMISQAVEEINRGTPLSIVFFEEGAPYSLYGMGIIKGKEENTAVKEVFDYLLRNVSDGDKAKFVPERIYRDKEFSIKNYPSSITYADMSHNTSEEKERLLAKWNH